MTIYYSPKNNGFYTPQIHEQHFKSEEVETFELVTMPGADEPAKVVTSSTRNYWPDPQGLISDAVLITPDLHRQLLDGQAGGKVIELQNNTPTLVDPPPLTTEQYNELQRQRREAAFRNEYDPLAGKYLRNEATQQELIDLAADIRARFPYQE